MTEVKYLSKEFMTQSYNVSKYTTFEDRIKCFSNISTIDSNGKFTKLIEKKEIICGRYDSYALVNVNGYLEGIDNMGSEFLGDGTILTNQI